MMMLPVVVFTLPGAIASALFVAAVLWLFVRRDAELAPSPPNWPPLVGHAILLQRVLTGGGVVDGLRRRYGPVFRLRVGRFAYVVLASAEAAQEALVKNGACMASRPLLPSTGIFSANHHTISASPYGALWRALRRNLVSEMLTPAKVKSFKPARDLIIERLLQRLAAQGRGGGAVDVYATCKKSVFELLLLICFGVHFKYEEDENVQGLHGTIERILKEYVSVASIAEFYPVLKPLAYWNRRLRQKLQDSHMEIFGNLLEEKKKAQGLGEALPGSYVETLEDLRLEGGRSISAEEKAALCTELLVGGTDTTVSCLEWAMAQLVNNPHIQAKLHAEIESSTVAAGSTLREEDVENMPYLRAVIKETLRLHPPGHTLFPHLVTQPCTVAGFRIPAGSLVDCHLPSISRSATAWEDPLEFKPERFMMMAHEAEMVADMASSSKNTIPFGAGRRICPGAGVAVMHAALIVGRLVQEFEWESPLQGPNKKVDMAEQVEFTVVMKTPLRATIRPRQRHCMPT